MRAESADDGQCRVLLTYAEVVTLHELLARSEWAGLFDDPINPAELDVVSALQQVLVPFVRGLGTDAYDKVVSDARAQLRLKAAAKEG